MSPAAWLFGIQLCFAACMDMHSTEVLLEQEHQQLLQVRQVGAPSQVKFTMMAKLVEEVFDGTILICFQERCNKHKSGSGLWPAQAQTKIVIMDGANVDRQFSLENELTHHAGATINHLMAVEAAFERGWQNLLILEDDIKENVVLHNSAEFVSAVRELLSARSWSGLKFTASYQGFVDRLEDKTCKLNCLCESVPDWNKTQNVSICQTRAGGPTSSGGNPLEVGAHSMVRYRKDIDNFSDHCDFRNSAAYALHASAFGPFIALLEDVKTARSRGPSTEWEAIKAVARIDKFVAANVPTMLHVLPLMVTQNVHSETSMVPELWEQVATLFSTSCKV